MWLLSLENQRGDALQFFSSPIGGVPVYQPVVNISKIEKIRENLNDALNPSENQFKHLSVLIFIFSGCLRPGLQIQKLRY